MRPCAAPTGRAIISKATFPTAVAAIATVLLLGTPSLAQAANCGAVNQRPCTVLERIPSCNAGLYEHFGQKKCLKKATPGADCGRQDQRPCTIGERVPSCNAGLEEDFIKRKCVPNVDAQRREVANRIGASAQAHQKTLGAIAACMSDPVRKSGLDGAVKAKNVQAVETLASPCVSAQTKAGLMVAPQGLAVQPAGGGSSPYFNSLTIGIGPSGMVLVGVGGDAGIVIDLNGKRPARLYTSGDWSFGVGASVGMDVIVGLSRDPVVPNISDNISVAASGKFLGGLGFAVVFNYGDPLKEDVLNGFAVSGGVGAGGEIGTIHKSNSRVW